jgi:Arc/MetJ-type ribon-helix-helix transcriptional regulator
MTIRLPEDLESSIRAEVLKGPFASEDEMVATAVRDYLRRKHGESGQAGNAARRAPAQGGEEPEAEELQRRLFEAGVLSEIKPPITDFTPYPNRHAVAVQGEPLSETIIRERR